MSTWASATMSKLSFLRCSFRGEKNKQEREALEDLASKLDSVERFWESEEGMKHFTRVMEGLSRTPTKSDYNTALVILAGWLLFR